MGAQANEQLGIMGRPVPQIAVPPETPETYDVGSPTLGQAQAPPPTPQFTTDPVVAFPPPTPQRADPPLPQVSQELQGRVRPGGRAEAFLEGRRARTGSAEDLARFPEQGVRPVSAARGRHLMGEEFDPETGLMVSTFDPEVATLEEDLANKRRARTDAVGSFITRGIPQAAGSALGAFSGLAQQGLQRSSDADAANRGSLNQTISRLTGKAADFAGELSEAGFEYSDKKRDLLAGDRSAINPNVIIREPSSAEVIGQTAGAFAGEIGKYVVGGGLVRAGLRGAGILGKAQKVVPKHRNVLKRWGESITETFKRVGIDVGVYAGVDAATSYREIDSAAYFVEMLTQPEMVEKLRQGDDSGLEQVFDNIVIDDFAPWLNEVAANAVQTPQGRLAFEAALGGILDLGLRAGWGGLRTTGLNPLMAPSQLTRGGMRRQLDETIGTRQLELGGEDLGIGAKPEFPDSGIDPRLVGEEIGPELAPAVPARAFGDNQQLDITGFDTQALDRLEANTQAIDRAAQGLDETGNPAVTAKGNPRKVKTLLNEQARSRFGLTETDVKDMGVDVKDPEAYGAFLREQARSTEAPLTPDIGRNVERASWIVPDREDIIQLALRGDARSPETRFWYEEGEKTLRELVPDEEFDEFVRFFATFSMNTDPKTNFMEAVLNWNNVKRGDPIQGVMGGKKDKSKSVLAGEMLDTPKIWSFAENLRGDGDHVTVDLWMWRILQGMEPTANPADQAFTGLKYSQAREEFRAVARELTERTGREWTPAQVQAATWVEFRDGWQQALGKQPSGNDSFMDFAESVMGTIAGIEKARAAGRPRVISEAMPSPGANRIKRMTDGTADVQTRTEYSEARFKAVVPILRKVVRELGLGDAVGGAYGVESGVQKAVRSAQSKASLEKGTTLGQGGTWEGKWNSNLPFLLPPDTPRSTIRMIASVMGDLLEQDAVVASTLRQNDLEALNAAKDLAGNPTGLNGEHSGLSIVTRRFLNKETADALARHFDNLSKSDDPLADALSGVNFTQSGDVLHFIDFSGNAPQKFWDVIQNALASFENGRFWDELADINDMRLARTDGDLIGESYGTGQWDEIFNEARVQAGSDQVGRTLRPDFLESNRVDVRKKFDDIDAEFRERLDKRAREAGPRVEDNAVAQEPVGASRATETKLKGPGEDTGIVLASRPEVAGGALGLIYGLQDPDDPISPLGGAAIGVALTAGGRRLAGRTGRAVKESENPVAKRITKRLEGEPEEVIEATEAEVKAAIERMDAVEAAERAGATAPDAGPPVLPTELSRAAPRYRQASLQFESDIDRAAYIVRNRENRSQADQKYLDWLSSHGIDETEAVALGNRIAKDLSRLYDIEDGKGLIYPGSDELVVPADAKANARFQPKKGPDTPTRPVEGAKATDHANIDPEEFVNISKFGLTPGDLEEMLEAAIRKVVAETGMDPKKVFTWEQTKALARSMGIDPDDLATGLDKQKGAMGESGARLLAVRNVIRANTERMAYLYKKINEDPKLEWGSEEAAVWQREIEVLDGEVNKLLASYMPAMSEAGRVLNAAKIMAQNTMDPAVWLTRAKRIAGGAENIPADIKIEIERLARQKDKAGLIRLIGELNQSGIAEQIATLSKAFKLSGIPTQLMNLVSTFAHVGFEEAKDIPASLIDRYLVATGQATERTKSFGSVRARLNAARLGAIDGYHNALEVMKGNPLIGQAEKWDQAKYHVNIDLAQRTFGDIAEKLAEQTPLLRHVPEIPKWIDAAAQGFHKTVFGALGAGDAMLTHFAVRRSLAEQARVQAINKGFKGADVEREAAKILQGDIPIDMMMEAIGQGELATFRTRGKTARMITGGKRYLAKTSKDKSLNKGTRVLAGGSYLVTEEVAPFVQTPINVAGRIVEASPAMGAYRLAELGVHGASRAAEVAAPKQIKAVHDAFGVKPLKYKNGQQKAVVESLARATTAMPLIAAGWYMYGEKLMSLGYTPEKAGQRQLTGEQENSWKVGDNYISLERISPVGNLMLMGGYMRRAWENSGDPDVMNPWLHEERTVLERAIGVGGGKDAFGESLLMESAEGAARSLLEQTFLTGVRELLDAVSRTEKEGAKPPLSPQMFASAAVPNIIRRIDRYMDPVSRMREDPSDYLRQAVPGASIGLPPRRDPFGQEIRYEREGTSPLATAYRTMIDPLQTSPDLTTDADGNLNLRGLLRELDVNVAKRPRGEFETPQEFDERQIIEGAELEEALSNFVRSPRFNRISRPNLVLRSEAFRELEASGHLNAQNEERLMDALVKALQAEAISQEIANVRSRQAARQNARVPGTRGLTLEGVQAREYQQRLQGRER
jgi:hypothetical protein